MTVKQEFEFDLDPKPLKPGGESAPMHVTISTDGNRVSITGTSGEEKYVGTLILTKKGADKADGDHCWVCDGDNPCVWRKPCPY